MCIYYTTEDYQPNEEEGYDDDGLMIGNRDALQESPSHAPSERPDSVEFPSLPLTHQTSPLHPLTHLADGEGGSMTGSQDSLSRPTYEPGELSHDNHVTTHTNPFLTIYICHPLPLLFSHYNTTTRSE